VTKEIQLNWDRLRGKRASAKPFEQPLLSVVLLGAVAVIGIVVGALLTPRQTRVSRHHWKR
jgi:hypothetical protein